MCPRGCCRDRRAVLWPAGASNDAPSGKGIAALTGHGGSVNSAAFRPDGSRIITASLGQDRARLTRAWDVGAMPKGNIMQVACALLRLHEDPVSLEGVTDYPLTFDPPTVCATDPPRRTSWSRRHPRADDGRRAPQ
jgi:hypothetical protein